MEIETTLATLRHAIVLAKADMERAQAHVWQLERMWNRAKNNNGMIPASSFVPPQRNGKVVAVEGDQHREERLAHRREMRRLKKENMTPEEREQARLIAKESNARWRERQKQAQVPQAA